VQVDRLVGARVDDRRPSSSCHNSPVIQAVGAVQKFAGNALVQVRAAVAHDSYERLIPIECCPDVHRSALAPSEPSPSLVVIEQPQAVGIDTTALAQAVRRDPAIAEFCRFYVERRDDEGFAEGEGARKKENMK